MCVDIVKHAGERVDACGVMHVGGWVDAGGVKPAEPGMTLGTPGPASNTVAAAVGALATGGG